MAELKVRTEARIRSGETNYPQATIDMMTEVLDWSGLTEPVMVIGFAPPLYPAYHSDQMAGKEGGGYQVDFNEIGKLNIPAVLMGPWGKDIHRRTERVNRKSLLVELPEILHTLIENM